MFNHEIHAVAGQPWWYRKYNRSPDKMPDNAPGLDAIAAQFDTNKSDSSTTQSNKKLIPREKK